MSDNGKMMNSFKLVFVLMLLTSTHASGESEEPVGMVLVASEDAFIERKGEREPAQLAALLYTGDRVVTASGKLTVLFCPTSEQLEVAGGSRVMLSDLSWKQEEGPPVIPKAAGRCVLPRVALGKESLERVGGLRPRGYAPIAIYLGGPITSANPCFEWDEVDEVEAYHLWIRNDQGRVVWEKRTSENRIRYPDSDPILDPGRYSWEVQARKGTEVLGQQTAWFEIRPNPELKEREFEGPADLLIQAAQLEQDGYFAEAAALFRRLRDENPDDVRLTSRLAWLYWNAGLMRASVEEQERLDRLEAAGKRP